MIAIIDLQKCQGYHELADLFHIPVSQWKAALYEPIETYKTFAISKRSGGQRLIQSPVGDRRAIQEALAPVLNSVYKPSEAAHGFICSRSVVTNARPHLGQNTLINLDLENFFNSISFQRVRGLFLATPFSFQWSIATILAQACCFRSMLPAGGITSPVISNFVSVRLDRRLQSLATRHGGKYTRYADDITLSFLRPLSQLPGLVAKNSAGTYSLGPKVSEIIGSEGFAPNNAKFHIAEKNCRKIVTGVVISTKLNPRRKWLRVLDSLVYAVEKFGLQSVATQMYPTINPSVSSRILARRIHGRISYLSMIRGAGDWIATDLAHRFNKFSGHHRLQVPDTELVSEANRVERAIFILTAKGLPSANDLWDIQGTAFVRRDGIVVTAAHCVVKPDNSPYPILEIRSYRSHGDVIPCKLVHLDTSPDLAFLKPKIHSPSLIRYRLLTAASPTVGQAVTSIGFPDYLIGHKPSKQVHEITQILIVGGVRKARITGDINAGLSGAAVVDGGQRVAGFVHRGIQNGGFANEIVLSDEIPLAFPWLA